MRILGLLIAVALIATTLALRHRLDGEARAILAAEDRARTKIGELHDLSMQVLARGEAHPGLAWLIGERPELGLVSVPAEDFDPPPECELAVDEAYVYALTDTVERDPRTGERSFGYVLRAWPLRYGETGDLEFHVTDDGRLYGGQNRVGRSGFARGFPPPFPEPALETLGGESAWWRYR